MPDKKRVIVAECSKTRELRNGKWQPSGAEPRALQARAAANQLPPDSIVEFNFS